MTKLGIRAKNAITMAAVMVLAMGWFTVAAWAAPCDGPAETKKIVMMGDWLPWASMGPMFAAQLSGYHADEGIEVEVIAPANPADPIKLVARERVNFSLTYVPEVMLSRETGIPVVSVAATLRVMRCVPKVVEIGFGDPLRLLRGLSFAADQAARSRVSSAIS